MSLFVVRKEMACRVPHACSFHSPRPGHRLHPAYLLSNKYVRLDSWHLPRFCAQQQKHPEYVPCRLPPKHCSYFKNYPYTYLCCSPAPIPQTFLRRRCVQKPIFSRHQTFHSISTSSHPRTKSSAPIWICVCFLPKRHLFKHMLFASKHSSHPPFSGTKVMALVDMCLLPPKNIQQRNHGILFRRFPSQNQPQKSGKERNDSPVFQKRASTKRMPVCRWTPSPLFHRIESDRVLQNEKFKVT